MDWKCALFMHARRSPRQMEAQGGMIMSGGTKALAAAKRAKKDEFYTQRVDIENELRHYKAHFADKVVLCNCDDPRQS